MISVVITDYLQFVILSFGFIIATVLAISDLGWNHIFETIALHMGEKGFNPVAADSSFGWEYVIWMCFIAGLVGSTVWPTTVARVLAADSTRTVQKQFMWASVSYTIRFLIPYFWGIAAFVYITTYSPQLREILFPTSGNPPLIDNIYAMPIFLGRILPAGLIGLITAAMIAAFMSTHDSYLLCWSSVITQDIIAPLLGDKLSNKNRILFTRIGIVLIGIYILYWGLIYEGSDDIWDYMAVSGSVYAIGAFALLLGGLYWKRASSTGAFLTLCSGILVLAGLGPVKQALGIPPEVSSARIGLISIAVSLTVLVVFSLLFPDKKVKKDV
jgi:SSS family solute:Na+ symporter